MFDKIKYFLQFLTYKLVIYLEPNRALPLWQERESIHAMHAWPSACFCCLPGSPPSSPPLLSYRSVHAVLYRRSYGTCLRPRTHVFLTRRRTPHAWRRWNRTKERGRGRTDVPGSQVPALPRPARPSSPRRRATRTRRRRGANQQGSTAIHTTPAAWLGIADRASGDLIGGGYWTDWGGPGTRQVRRRADRASWSWR